MNMFMVAKEKPDGSGIEFPPLLPNDRGRKAQLCLMGFTALLIIVGTVKVLCVEGCGEAMTYLVAASSIGIFTVGMIHFIKRTCLVVEEFDHIPGRYHDRNSIFSNTYMCNKSSLIFFVLSILYVLIWNLLSLENPYTYLWRKGPLPNMIAYMFGICFCNLIDMEDSITHISLQIEKMKSLDYGSGMAYNYFYGYLRLVLPDPEIGIQAKDANGILKRIETFINHHHLSEDNFPVKKLFILIPQSLRTPTDLKTDSTDYPDNTKYWMEAAVSLEPQELDRAGVKQRVYKNSVYKIKDWDNPIRKPVYVVAEGATPLKTLYDVIKMNPKMSRIFKNHQPEIVSTFYKTLLEIIRYTDDCRDLCEIIYYVDTDEHGRKVNIARIILDRIRELESRGNLMAAANDNW